MRIIIAGGNHEADYVIKTLKKRGNKLFVINEDPVVAKYLSSHNKVDVYTGDITKKYVYDDIEAQDFDLFVALSNNDADNYVACLLANKLFNIARCICTVSNPKNVDLFKELGINYVVSATYLLAGAIKDEISFEDIIKTMRFEHERIVLTEIQINEEYKMSNTKIMDTKFPSYANISCVYRNPEVIIPRGDTLILPNDKLLIISSPENQKKVIEFVTREKDAE